MTTVFIIFFMALLTITMELTWLVDTVDDKEKEKQKRIKEVAKHLHPH